MLSADRWLREGRGDVNLPLAFVEKQRGAMRLIAVNEIALSLGIAPGMALADARARVPDLAIAPYDRAADAALLAEIADDCDRYTPMVALDPPDGLMLDITGCAHLWQGEGDLVSALAARLAHAGFTLRLALADTPDKARALARHGGEMLAVNRRTAPGMLNEDRMGYAAPPPLAGEGLGHLPTGQSDERLSIVQSRHSGESRNLFCCPWQDESGIPAFAGMTASARYRTKVVHPITLHLPITALDLDEERTTALRRAGLYTIDDLASRPRAPLAARFGKAAVAKLARVLGEEDVRITPRRVPPALFFLRRFAEPIARTDFVLEVIGDLSAEAAIELQKRGQGGRRFTTSLFRSDGDTRRLTIETGAPTRDVALLIRLFRERIDALSDPLDPGFGYDAVRLDIAVAETLGPVQVGLEGEVVATEAVNALLDRLGVRLGHNRVRRFASGNSHIPELAAFTHPANTPLLPMPWPEVEPGEPPLRPLHLFDPPHRVEVIAEVPDGPPRRFRWRRVTHDVTRFEGPERIASEWWKRRDGKGLTRDYFRVEDSRGRRFWLFRHGLYGGETTSPDWYLHGCFA